MPELGQYAFNILSAFALSILILALLAGLTMYSAHRAKDQLQRAGKPDDNE